MEIQKGWYRHYKKISVYKNVKRCVYKNAIKNDRLRNKQTIKGQITTIYGKSKKT